MCGLKENGKNGWQDISHPLGLGLAPCMCSMDTPPGKAAYPWLHGWPANLSARVLTLPLVVVLAEFLLVACLLFLLSRQSHSEGPTAVHSSTFHDARRAAREVGATGNDGNSIYLGIVLQTFAFCHSSAIAHSPSCAGFVWGRE